MGIAGLAVGMIALLGPASASAICQEGHVDYTPKFEHVLDCEHSEGPVTTWDVPARVFRAEFWLHGGDALDGTDGGTVRAVVWVTPGNTLRLEMGGPGEASSVSWSGIPLLVAGDGDGATPNHVSYGAKVISVTAPGGGPDDSVEEGWMSLTWEGNPDPPPEPFPFVHYDFFADRTDQFAPAGGTQTWTVPNDVESVGFELRGGIGDSGFPAGHVIATLPVVPGDSFEIEVGGPGDATTLRDAASHGLIARAAGGDDWTVNALSSLVTGGERRYVGGGPGGVPSSGWLAVHQYTDPTAPPDDPSPLPGDPPPLPGGQPPSPGSQPSPEPAAALAPPSPPPAAGPGKAAPTRRSCRIQGRRLSRGRCLLEPGRLSRGRAVSGPGRTGYSGGTPR